jgi:hypothetical protein
MTRLRAFTAPAWIAGGAAALWLWIGVGFANYDTLYALVWGQQLGRGETPTYSLSIAPTPHPLLTLIGLILSPLGPGATADAIVGLAYVMLAALGYVVYRLGSAWFDWTVGLLAAAIVLTREPFLSYGIRAYVDVPYLVLVLSALLVQTRRRAAGWPVLALLGLAGLLRPEAWLFGAAYWIWLWRRGERPPGELARLAALVAAPALLWGLSDLLVTGNPVWSFTKTRDTAATLHRVRGLQNVPITGSRRIGEILREPGLVGAAVGGALSLIWLRERVALAVGAGAVAVVAFCLLAIGGLPLVTRYVFVIAALLAVFAAAGALGWRTMPTGDARRRRWQLVAAVVAVGLVAFIPSQAHRLDGTFDSLARQQRIQDDLVALVDHHQIGLRCGPIGVPNHRPIPLLALRLKTSPSNIVSAQVRQLSRGTYVDPADAEVKRDYTLDPHDPHPLVAAVPPGFVLSAENRSWRVYTRCA